MTRKSVLLASCVAAPLAALVVLSAVTPVTADKSSARMRLADASSAAAPGETSKALFTDKCSACHDLPNPTDLSYTRDEWQKVVDKMLTKYGASDEISPTEASVIVDYLATFAPKPSADRRPAGDRRWASETDDVWPLIPSLSRVTNFEANGALSHLDRIGVGARSKPVWQLINDGASPKSPDGTVARVSNPGAGADAFALLEDPLAKGADIDVKVRFKIVSGDTSPAVGIAVGMQDAQHYMLVRYDRKSNDLALIDVAEPSHTTVQQTPLGTIRETVPVARTVALNCADAGWHTLRVMVKDGQARAWIDSYKRINTAITGYSGGAVALWSQGDTVALFDDWSTDVYDGATE